MYNVCKDVIMSQRFELSAMLHKLDALWVQGNLTDDQYRELVAMAQANADPAMSANFAARLESLEARVKALEGEPDPGVYPEYIPGTPAKNGDIYTWMGKTYKCIAPEGQVCVWSPDDYPVYWELVKG